MLEQYNLATTIDEKTYGKTFPVLKERLAELQRSCRDQGVPVVILIEGWNASGITHVAGDIVHSVDPRGYDLHSIGAPTDEEKAHSLIWRFFIKTPEKGRIAIFARSWYSRLLAEKITGVDWEARLESTIRAINNFERQLTDDGTLILKFFLHISKEEQCRRMLAREKNSLTAWMITKGDWDFHKQYDMYLPVIEQIIEASDFPHAPWTIVEATDPQYASHRVISRITKSIDKRLGPSALQARPPREPEPDPGAVPDLGAVDLLKTVPKSEYESRLAGYLHEIRDVQYLLYKRKVPLIIVYEGWDAAGKGGNIHRLTLNMNPRGYEVIPVMRPDEHELAHHYLWRFYTRFPKAGNITIFDRSWYGRVLVERVEGFCTDQEWRRAYREINEMEEYFVTEGGGILKFWLEVSPEEQLARFREREHDPRKQWKITEEDWRNREKWEPYREALDEMLAKTSTRHAPWTIVESEDKYYARLKTLRDTIDYAEKIL